MAERRIFWAGCVCALVVFLAVVWVGVRLPGRGHSGAPGPVERPSLAGWQARDLAALLPTAADFPPGTRVVVSTDGAGQPPYARVFTATAPADCGAAPFADRGGVFDVVGASNAPRGEELPGFHLVFGKERPGQDLLALTRDWAARCGRFDVLDVKGERADKPRRAAVLSSATVEGEPALDLARGDGSTEERVRAVRVRGIVVVATSSRWDPEPVVPDGSEAVAQQVLATTVRRLRDVSALPAPRAASPSAREQSSLADVPNERLAALLPNVLEAPPDWFLSLGTSTATNDRLHHAPKADLGTTSPSGCADRPYASYRSVRDDFSDVSVFSAAELQTWPQAQGRYASSSYVALSLGKERAGADVAERTQAWLRRCGHSRSFGQAKGSHWEHEMTIEMAPAEGYGPEPAYEITETTASGSGAPRVQRGLLVRVRGLVLTAWNSQGSLEAEADRLLRAALDKIRSAPDAPAPTDRHSHAGRSSQELAAFLPTIADFPTASTLELAQGEADDFKRMTIGSGRTEPPGCVDPPMFDGASAEHATAWLNRVSLQHLPETAFRLANAAPGEDLLAEAKDWAKRCARYDGNFGSWPGPGAVEALPPPVQPQNQNGADGTVRLAITTNLRWFGDTEPAERRYLFFAQVGPTLVGAATDLLRAGDEDGARLAEGQLERGLRLITARLRAGDPNREPPRKPAQPDLAAWPKTDLARLLPQARVLPEGWGLVQNVPTRDERKAKPGEKPYTAPAAVCASPFPQQRPKAQGWLPNDGDEPAAANFQNSYGGGLRPLVSEGAIGGGDRTAEDEPRNATVTLYQEDPGFDVFDRARSFVQGCARFAQNGAEACEAGAAPGAVEALALPALGATEVSGFRRTSECGHAVEIVEFARARGLVVVAQFKGATDGASSLPVLETMLREAVSRIQRA
ncbi:MAG: hypothetical protein ACRC20_08160 [Segniliparus sp.]|uniref:hypothetical protein n=1 Tax=Segniliparus sp. TaxID=2804064 RepID=UPI003F341937